MNITPQVLKTMIEARFHEYPQMKAVMYAENFRNLLLQILDFEKVDQSLLPQIENEILVVLTLYAPLHELAENITETTGIPIEISKNITTLIETLILQPVYDDLVVYDSLWESELKKNGNLPSASRDIKDRLELRPEGAVRAEIPQEENSLGQTPLTREAVRAALTPQRTMASDIESIKRNDSGAVHGYEAYRNAQKDE